MALIQITGAATRAGYEPGRRADAAAILRSLLMRDRIFMCDRGFMHKMREPDRCHRCGARFIDQAQLRELEAIADADRGKAPPKRSPQDLSDVLTSQARNSITQLPQN